MFIHFYTYDGFFLNYDKNSLIIKLHVIFFV
jgi:hypothetical protein